MANTPKRTTAANRISVARLYTQKGVHPYDTVTWERRNVVQTNWKTGDVVFEQRGVEFPDFWSVNASTIVTTKYFRGAAGSSEREHSLKQLVDRVVDTYVKAAKEHGYFADEESLEIFEHELKYMLVHQVFSFNSPVWFNVGTSSKMQVSACFILAVDDTMDSILNWYKEEGLIFKGGSGAGLNLSRIRSSKELLRSSGGTASGPVSFMRGADASAGTIKSGGATRRAAKMVVLDVDHPDIEEFIETKVREEDKIRALRDAGFDMELGGKDITSVQYQNANNSVRVSDLFMNAVTKNEKFGLLARTSGEVIESVNAKELFRKMSEAAWACADPGIQYDDTINDWHTTPESGRITASNPCSEYLSLDNSSCNLASLNLMSFMKDGTFQIEEFIKATELIFTAMDVSICFADFPTEAIGETTRKFRQLGIGYANLGALLMSQGLAYDSPQGRALAAAITSLMTGAAYRQSAVIAGVVGPYEGFTLNKEAHARVMRKHAHAARELVESTTDTRRSFITANLISAYQPAAQIAQAALEQWETCLKLGGKNGWRNAQASLLAPTGCITADSLVTTDQGLLRMDELGDPYGTKWQDTDFKVSTDSGPQKATHFFINGEEETRRLVTAGGWKIQGTPTHRLRAIDNETGEWKWVRFADVKEGDIVPIQLGGMIGEPRAINLPVLGEAWNLRPSHTTVPSTLTPDLAEIVGYFMGDGSLHSKGIRLCVANTDLEVVGHLSDLAKKLFNIEAAIALKTGYTEVALHSVQLAQWWEAAGFAKTIPNKEHVGKGWIPTVPLAVRASNDRAVYAAFLRGLMEADGSVTAGVPALSSAKESFIDEVRALMTAVGIPTTTSKTSSGMGGPIWKMRVRNLPRAIEYSHTVGFLSDRKQGRVSSATATQGANKDHVYLPRQEWDRLAPISHPMRSVIVSALAKHGAVPRTSAIKLAQTSSSPALEKALGFLFEKVTANEDGGPQPTFDLSVPGNVTYVANGFVSHNTISFMMDCDTTGIEPDFALVKFKKLVDGGSMQIVNGQVPPALDHLGYTPTQAEDIVAHIATNGGIVGAPHLRSEHYTVFDCAVGERAIKADGHVLMMAAVQPFLSGAISKTVNLPEQASVEDIEKVYLDGWKLGLKALAVYRDNCKVGQPLSSGDSAKSSGGTKEPQIVEKIVNRPVRKRLPQKRRSMTTSFKIGEVEGYMTVGEYPNGAPGEVFIKVSKQGSTLAGVMDGLAMSVSVALQYGVPLETFVSKFTNTRFEPSGMTNDADIRISQSILDWVGRRLAVDYLPFETRSAFGIYTSAERTAAQSTGVYAPVEEEVRQEDIAPEPKADPAVAEAAARKAKAEAAAAEEEENGYYFPDEDEIHVYVEDKPMCMTCGTYDGMTRTGACWACHFCGNSTGCS